jgi:thioredoxin reductase (NADPH)
MDPNAQSEATEKTRVREPVATPGFDEKMVDKTPWRPSPPRTTTLQFMGPGTPLPGIRCPWRSSLCPRNQPRPAIRKSRPPGPGGRRGLVRGRQCRPSARDLLIYRTLLDALIIGAGPAGLTAAIYLGRFRRAALVIDGEMSRARWIPRSHNLLGFPQGISGQDLLAQLRTHCQQYGTAIRPGTATNIACENEGFAVALASEVIRSRFVILATGVEDQLPDLPAAEDAIRRGVLRICPICDAYETIGKRVAVLGNGPRGEREADFLRAYSNLVTLLYIGEAHDPERRLRMKARGIELIETTLNHLTIEQDHLRLRQSSRHPREFDACYTALGCSPRNTLATALGAACDENNQLLVSAHCETSIPGLYAVGDIVRGLNQVVVAAAEAAIAATHIHNRLRNSQSA